MYIICYGKIVEKEYIQLWERVNGEDAMQIRVSELLEDLECVDEEIHIFEEKSQL